MKMQGFIGAFLLLLLTACGGHEPVAMRQDTPLPSELVAVDTLMQLQPDSALALLLDQPRDDPYYQLLLSEALYKNDFAQANRDALQAAMAYYDSIGDPFLAARCHYMNGVGYYEMDSVIPACEQYLKALEIMETGFEEKDLVGYKAKFMALTYNRLGDLFSGQFMMGPAICCYRKALAFNAISPTSPYGIAKTLYRIGVEYDKSEIADSAIVYFDLAAESLPDTLNLVYRNIQASRIYSEYHSDNNAEYNCIKLKHLEKQAENNEERMARCLVIGSIYCEGQLYDSSVVYLKKVLDSCKNALQCIQAAEYLRVIYDDRQDTEKVGECALFLSQYTVHVIQQKAAQSQLADLFQNHRLKHGKQYMNETGRRKPWFWIGLIVLLAALIIIFIIFKRILKSTRLAEKHGILVKARNESMPLPEPAKGNYNDFTELLYETVCQGLTGRFKKTDIITTNKPEYYFRLACTSKEKRQLLEAFQRHCPNYEIILRSNYPSIQASDLELCRFYLLGLNNQQIAVLLQKHYTTIWRRSKKIEKLMDCIEPQRHLISLLFEMGKN